MIEAVKNKKLTGCMFLNRSYVRWQHAVALDLKKRYGVEKWCAYGYGKSAYELRNQEEVKYEPLLIDDFLAQEAKDEIVDEKYLETKEKEYGHPFWWQEFTSDRFISINWPRQFYPMFNPTLNHHELKQHFQLRIKKIEKMLDEVKPDFVLFADAGAMGVNILYHIAKKKGIPTIVIGFTRFTGLAGLTNNLFGTFNVLEKIFKQIRSGRYTSPKKGEAMEWIKKFRGKPIKSAYATSEFWNKSKQSFTRQFVLFAKNFIRKSLDLLDNSFPKVYAYSPLDFIKHHLLFWSNSLRRLNFDQSDKHENYAFFALTSEPELSLLMLAPYYTDQAWVIRAIAQSLPLNLKLYVKEHPVMSGYRNPNFYKEIRKFPNIKLVDTRIDSVELIKNAKLVVTITGTVGLEALIFKKPVITFGSPSYHSISLIRKCRTLDELPLLVKDALENHKHDDEELVDFLAALFEDSFKVDLTRLIHERDIEKIKQNPDISAISDQVMKYLKSYAEPA